MKTRTVMGGRVRYTVSAALGTIRVARKPCPEWLMAGTVFCLFWLVSTRYVGPAYLSDEISYLGHAARLAGYAVDGADGAHAGYSLLLAPLFRFFSEPGQVWQAVVALNAAMWAVSSILLIRLVARFLPGQSTVRCLAAVAVAMSYPTWLAMSGYAFATSAVVLVFMVSLAAALGVDLRRRWSVVPHSLATGFLYWVHPTGLAVAAASIVALAVVSFRTRQYVSLVVHIALVSVLIVVYQEGLRQWLLNAGTVPGFTPTSQYPSLTSLLSHVSSLSFWFHTATKALGQASYLAVGSLGLAVFGFVELARLARERLLAGSSDDARKGASSGYAHLFVLLSILGVIIMGSAYFSTSARPRVDHWIYGRYAEGVLLPLLAMGFLARVRRSWLLLLAVGLVGCGALLAATADFQNTNNIVNTISLWPQYFVENPDYLRWMALGALGVVVFQVARQEGRAGKAVALVLLVGASVLSGVNAAKWHQDILADYSKPSGFVNIVRANFEAGSSVGFNPEMPADATLFQRERCRLPLFYLYDYAYQRMYIADWLNSCDGPLLTYQIDELQGVPGTVLLGQEMRSGLYLVAKERDLGFQIPCEAPTERTFYPAEEWVIRQDLYRYGEQLTALPSRVGGLRDGTIVSTGRTGFLVFGPYVRMDVGEYNLVVRGTATSAASAWVDVASSLGSVEHARFALSATEGETGVLASGRVVLDEDVTDLEVRVYVGRDDEVRLDGYELVPVGVA